MDKNDIDRVLEALQAVEVDGLTLKLGVLRHTPDSGKVTITVTRAGVTAELLELRRYYPSLEGKEIPFDGKQFRLVGFAPRRKAYAFIGRDLVSGKLFKLRTATVLRHFKIENNSLGYA